MTPTVLFINHPEVQCGVGQMGRRYFSVFHQSDKYDLRYIEVMKRDDFYRWRDQLQPKAIVYNYYSGDTMPWLSKTLIADQKPFLKQLCLFHELSPWEMGFDLILHQDPASTDEGFNYVRLPRMIPAFAPPRHVTDVPVFGSFGFGLGGKGFSRIIDAVQAEYDQAIIRLHIPFAAFGDKEGKGARDWVEDAQKRIVKPDIELMVTHEFKPQNALLIWLSQNDCNCFFYDENYGRGISGVLDYALAARRPIAITRSWQFKHVWLIDDSFTIEKTSLRSIVERGTDHLEVFHQMWNDAALVQCFEDALLSLGVT